jgi:uncharacterized protein YkwD
VAPEARRRPALLAALALVVAMALLTSCLSNNQSKTLGQLNTDRNHNGMRSLSPLSQSVSKAQAWADHLAAIGYLQHSSLASSYSVRWCALGENVGYGPYTSTVEGAFMASPTHRGNILSGTWNHAGTGVARRGSTVFVVQEFIKTC